MKNTPKDERLNDQQEKFALLVARGKTATKAAILAGYKKRSAHTMGYRMMKKPKIQARIEEIRKKHLAALNITENWILAEMRNMAEGNISDYFEKDEKGEMVLKDFADLPEEVQKRVKSLNVNSRGWKIELFDRRAILVDLAKIKGIYQDTGMVNNHFNTVFVVPAFGKGKNIEVVVPKHKTENVENEEKKRENT